MKEPLSRASKIWLVCAGALVLGVVAIWIVNAINNYEDPEVRKQRRLKMIRQQAVEEMQRHTRQRLVLKGADDTTFRIDDDDCTIGQFRSILTAEAKAKFDEVEIIRFECGRFSSSWPWRESDIYP